MESNSQGLEQIHDRLRKLERQNRRLKQLGAAVLIVTASLLFMGQASPKKTVEANEFILRDTSGNVRASLSVDEKTPALAAQLVLFDKEGRQRMKVDSGWWNLSGGTLTLADQHGRDRVALSSDDHGGTLSLLDEKGAPGTLMNTDSADLPNGTIHTLKTNQLFLITKDKQTRGLISVSEGKEGFLSLMGADGEEAVHLTPTLVGFSASQSKPKAIFGRDGLYVSDDRGFAVSVGVTELVTPQTGEAHKTSAASIVLFGDKDKNVLWRAP